MTKLSIVIPVKNESENVSLCQAMLLPFQQLGHEVIIVDGGSADDSVSKAQWADHVVISEPGRAIQMNAGAALSQGDILWFLHVDSVVSCTALKTILAVVEHSQWGFFNVVLSGRHWLLRVVEWMMNWRSKWTGIATGDQGLFLTRALFDELGGFAGIPLMEDVELCTRLKKMKVKPGRINDTIKTSSRKWEKGGVVSTIFLMWKIRFLYALGRSPDQLVKLYYR
ncbi:MAG: glycosyltransferase family 2 protein [Methylococcales bacterium]|nr:glycosyltransferase family 2 protein [Methylococcales bacterium]MBT7442958.1 glycosyltransferase family 2 protein [Methylococcales bacterium]